MIFLQVENLKQALTDVEEKVQYQSEERIRDIHEALDLCQTKVSYKKSYFIYLFLINPNTRFKIRTLPF